MSEKAYRKGLEEIRLEADLKRQANHRLTVRVCNTGCRARGSSGILERLRECIKDIGLEGSVLLKPTGCHGLCEMGPVMVIEPQGIFYGRIEVDDVPEIVGQTISKGKIIDRLIWKDGAKAIPFEKDIPFYTGQSRVVLERCGRIDPLSIEDYIANGGYSSLEKALFEMTPIEVLEEVERSGLRGRGGGGFPVGRKWRSCREAEGHIKYVIANGDEGDPGAFMDRSLMEGDPHSIIEGMIIGAYAIGAHEGFIYVRDEYPIAVDHLTSAVLQAEKYGLLGENIMGSGFDFRVRVIRGAGAFVCGESTALMNSLEGKVGEPRAKYIHTVEMGYKERPSNLNNVETWANIPIIIKNGAEWYAGIGTERSKGTKIFSLVGKVKNTGLVEVPMGMTLKEIIFHIGGGIKEGKRFKAVQTGGPSGGCIPENRLHVPVDFDHLTEVGSMMGSGGMIVMDEDTCMVDVARYFVEFLMYESCGKCTPCREGLIQMNAILKAICRGNARIEDISFLEDLSSFMKDSSLCGLGQTAPNPVLSTLRYFRKEYEAHIIDRRCPAGVCKELIQYVIDINLCNGCTLCMRECPQRAISGERGKPHRIENERCIKCGLCMSICRQKAIRVQNG